MSGWFGFGPTFFRSLNAHVHTLKTHKVVCIKFQWQKGNIALPITVYPMTVLNYCCLWHVRTVSSYVECEITSLNSPGPVQVSIVCGMYSQQQKAGWEPGKKGTHSILNVNSESCFPLYVAAKKQSPRTNVSYGQSMISYYVTESTGSNYWNSVC